MKNFNLLIVTLAASLLSVQATNTKETTTVTIPEKVREKYLSQLYFVKVNPTLLDNTLDFYPLIKDVNKNRDTDRKVFNAKIDELYTSKQMSFLGKKYSQLDFDLESIRNQNFDLSEIIQNRDHFDYLYQSAVAVIKDEQLELDILKTIPNLIKSYGPLTISKDIARNLMWKAQSHLNDFGKCTVDNILECEYIGTGPRSNYKQIVTDFKTLLLAKQMTDGPEELEKRIQEEFIRPDWKTLINSNELNLKVAKITQSLNFEYLYKEIKLDPETAIKNMIETLGHLIKSLAKKKEVEASMFDTDKYQYLEDLRLRKKFLELVYNFNYSETEKKEPLKLVDILGPVRAIERYAEGVLRAALVDGPGKADKKSAETIIKLWLMSLQMFKKDGWLNNKYVKELIPIPEDWKSTIEPTAAPVMETNPSASVSANPVTPKTFPVVIEKPDAIKDVTRERSNTAETVTSKNSDVPVENVQNTSKLEPKKKGLFSALGF